MQAGTKFAAPRSDIHCRPMPASDAYPARPYLRGAVESGRELLWLPMNRMKAPRKMSASAILNEEGLLMPQQLMLMKSATAP